MEQTASSIKLQTVLFLLPFLLIWASMLHELANPHVHNFYQQFHEQSPLHRTSASVKATCGPQVKTLHQFDNHHKTQLKGIQQKALFASTERFLICFRFGGKSAIRVRRFNINPFLLSALIKVLSTTISTSLLPNSTF